MAQSISVYNKVVFCDKNVGKKDDIKLVSELKIANKVGSILELATSLDNLNNTQQKGFNFVMVCGHGGPGVQGVGSKRNPQYTKGKDFDGGELDDIANEISTIANSLDTTKPVKPVFFLGGCEVGCDSDGSELLINLSKRLPNVVVVAATNSLGFSQVHFRKQLVAVNILATHKQKLSTEPPAFKFAFNGSLIPENKVQSVSGVDGNNLIGELTSINSTN